MTNQRTKNNTKILIKDPVEKGSFIFGKKKG